MGGKQSRYNATHSSDRVHRIQRSSKSRNHNATKILMLGSGSVGVSTVWKSIRVAYHDPLEERLFTDTKSTARMNVVQSMMSLLQKLAVFCPECPLNGYIEDIGCVSAFSNVEQFQEVSNKHLHNLSKSVHKLWNWAVIREVYQLRLHRKFWFMENMGYWFDKVSLLMHNSYSSDVEDWLRVRVRTSGVNDYFMKDPEYGVTLQLRDVGGERNERRKWNNLFEDVNCIFYVCSLAQYCLSLFEDEEKCGLLENLQLFQELIQNKWLRYCKFIVLLNATDLFRDSLVHTPLTFCFGDEYQGRNYNDPDISKTKTCEYVIRRLIMHDIDTRLEMKLSHDVVGIINSYCDNLKFPRWSDVVYRDGIHFVKQKFLHLKPDITIYEVCALNTEHVKCIMDEIRYNLLHDSEPVNNKHVRPGLQHSV